MEYFVLGTTLAVTDGRDRSRILSDTHDAPPGTLKPVVNHIVVWAFFFFYLFYCFLCRIIIRPHYVAAGRRKNSGAAQTFGGRFAARYDRQNESTRNQPHCRTKYFDTGTDASRVSTSQIFRILRVKTASAFVCSRMQTRKCIRYYVIVSTTIDALIALIAHILASASQRRDRHVNYVFFIAVQP